MKERVREILSWYGSDNPGTLTNLARMLNHGRLGGTGRIVILPVDQGFEHGPARSFAPNPAGYDPRYHFELAIDAGCNAYAAPLGFLEAGAAEFAGEIPLILKLNNSDSLSKGEPCSALTGSVDEALRLGCVGHRLHHLSRLVVAQRDVPGAARPRRGGEAQGPRGGGVVLPARLPASPRKARRRSTWSPTRRRSRRSSAPTSSR